MSDATNDPAYRQFETHFAALRRSRRTETWLIVAVVCLLVLVSAVATEFYPSRILAGIPRIGEYFAKLFSIVPERGAEPVPVLSLAHFFGGVKEPQSLAYWFYALISSGFVLFKAAGDALSLMLCLIGPTPEPPSVRQSRDCVSTDCLRVGG
jgi:phosphonate transport system permease protein